MECKTLPSEKTSRNLAVKYLIIIGSGLGAVMLLLLATAGANAGFLERRYQLLIALNVGFVLLLMVVVGYLLWRFRRRLKDGVFGSKLALRLLLIFSLMATLPGVLVYSVSVQFLGKSIESWFDIKVDRALEGGLNLGRSMLDDLMDELRAKTQTMAITLSKETTPSPAILAQLVDHSRMQEATLFNQGGGVVAFSGAEIASLVVRVPNEEEINHARIQGVYSKIDSIPDKGLYLWAVAPVNGQRPGEVDRILQLLQPVPKSLADDAEIVQAVYRDYQALSLSRQGMKELYAVTLTLALLLSLLSAIAAAFLISERLSAPLGMLAEGTRAVSKGDFSRRHPVQSKDELGVLTESFNLMTQQLEEARTVTQRNQHEVESARAYLESILSNLSSGVLVFDEELRLRTTNLSAEQILKVPLTHLEGLTMEECVAKAPQLHSLESTILRELHSERAGEWQCQVERSVDEGNQVLLLRGSRLPQDSGGGGVVVFDDITNLLQAQRTAAWGEVARRLAHEIKNPLTPIQLSAERMQHKLAEKLSGQDAEILQRSTEIIVNQVDALKRMVNEFSEYARAPKLELHLLDINKLVEEVLALYERTNEDVEGELAPHIELLLNPNIPLVRGDSARLRQVIHNLLQNAQDTLTGITEPTITVRTEVLQGSVSLSVSDNGGGFPDVVRARAFEPYVTTKPKGTGLGLPIVKKIVEEHNGTIQIENILPHGARISITLPMTAESITAAKTETV
jgi:nitrogen fixation/metabolism regulation signal transduction histidine kinase